ncbi:hypothetical protein [Amycolatopsis sp. H20-H5]|uniref:hypothetical protein n=1 Tax=Amycolatopsis sp. H20-H5 TaxID=3046309 RepID=UPI002DBAD8D7|nr:hypothetical protein [Amycolatopsis sp. H20-H5]MEC3977156.1 hypothetical protein [Amycolatopsis sp. H20-H5]
MIRAGRRALDHTGIAALHQLTTRQARRAQPWNQPGHPAPITTGRATHGRPTLWDTEQAETFAHGHPVPELPEHVPHGRDLLDRIEAARVVGVEVETWRRDTYRERVPPPDAELFGMPWWHRDTLEKHRHTRTAPHHGGGRPTGRADTTPRADIPARVRQLLQGAAAAGEPLNTADIARRLGIHYTTAHRHVHAIRAASGDDKTPGTPREQR